MPIKPENRGRYPKDWREIRSKVLERAGHKCEFCGVGNHAWGWRDASGTFTRLRKRELLDAGHKKTPFMLGTSDCGVIKVIEIVLTIAHLDHVPENCALENLKALCQRCHLTYDAEMHAQEARLTRRKGKAVADLFA